ncbi:MAG: branched-chain amino acid ABC transporter permease [Deltaproteobacteria bacterium]|nr:branched-chain amino acid ABC transporter permease [Deltaproteobacteria bacterium]
MEKRKERIDRGIKARSGDVFALSSWREMLYLAAPRLIPIIGFLVLPLILGVYWQKVLLSVAVFALLAISWDILAQTGMISLGQALFFGMGAYASGVINYYLGWHPLIAIPLASVIGGLICTAFLLPVLRLRGIYFSMVTLIIPLMLVRIVEATKIFGGTEGLSGIAALPSRWIELYLIMGVLTAALFGFRRMMGSDYGLVLKGISDNDRSVMNAGINIYWFKTQALFISSCIGAFTGAFLTHVYMFVGMPVFALDYSILPIAAAVVGGPGTLAGATLGAFILVPLSELLRGIGGLRIVFYGLFLVIFIVALPEGLFHYVQRKFHQFERWVEVE